MHRDIDQLKVEKPHPPVSTVSRMSTALGKLITNLGPSLARWGLSRVANISNHNEVSISTQQATSVNQDEAIESRPKSEADLFHEEITAAREAIMSTKTREELPGPFFTLEILGKRIIESGIYPIDLNADNNVIPDYPLLSETVQLVDLWNSRVRELAPEDNYQYNGREKILRFVQDIRAITRAFTPGHFLAHGGYFKDLDLMIKGKGMMTFASRVNHNLIPAESIPPRGGTLHSPDSNGIYFYQLDKFPEEWGKNPGHYHSSDRGFTDISIFYPAETILENTRVFEVRGVDGPTGLLSGEIVVTSSESSISSGVLDASADDRTVLPIESAYFQASSERANEMRKLFEVSGFGTDWINNHIVPADIINLQEWLNIHHKPPDKQTAVKKLKGDFYTGELV